MNKKKAVQQPAADPFETFVGYHLRRLSVMAMADLTRTLEPLDLKPADASILFALAARSGHTQSELGRALGIRRANMAPLIAALLKRGLVERSAVDGRSHALRLSATGRALQRQAWEATALHEETLFGSLTPAARKSLIALLGRLWRDRS